LNEWVFLQLKGLFVELLGFSPYLHLFGYFATIIYAHFLLLYAGPRHRFKTRFDLKIWKFMIW